MFNFFYKKNKKTIIKLDLNKPILEKDSQNIEKIQNETKDFFENSKKYKVYWTRHYEIIDKIRFELYSKAINEENIHNNYAEECIKLGYEDLNLAPVIIEYWKEEARIRKEEYKPLNYGSHIYLLKLLEKQQRYEEAINVCNEYIKLGLTNDGTKGGIVKRKEKLIQLNKKED